MGNGGSTPRRRGQGWRPTSSNGRTSTLIGPRSFTPQQLDEAHLEKRITVEMRLFIAARLADGLDGLEHFVRSGKQPPDAIANVFSGLLSAHVQEYGEGPAVERFTPIWRAMGHAARAAVDPVLQGLFPLDGTP